MQIDAIPLRDTFPNFQNHPIRAPRSPRRAPKFLTRIPREISRLTALLISILTCSVACQFPLHADDWPIFRGPNHNGISDEKDWSTQWPDKGPKVLWRANVGLGFSSFAVAGGRTYTMGNLGEQDSVYCFDAASGKPLWRHSYACPLGADFYQGGTSGTPTVDGKTVYTLSRKGHLHALDAEKGTVLWARNIINELAINEANNWGYAGSPLLDGNLLLLNAGGAGAAFDKATGKVVWKSSGKAGYSTPLPFGSGPRRGVMLFAGRSLVAVEPETGRTLWMFPWSTQYEVNAADPVIIGDRIVISSGYGTGAVGLQLQAGRVTQVWRNKNLFAHFASGLAIDGYLYAIHGHPGMVPGDLRCLDPKTGAIKWTERPVGLGGLTAADGKLIILSERGELIIADASPDSFKPIARTQVLGGTCWAAPVLANGRIYCRNGAGNVACVDVKGK